MHRFTTLLVLLLMAALLLAGCPAATPEPAQEPAAPATEAAAPAEDAAPPAASGEPFKIAFVLPSSITDPGARPCTTV